MVLRCWVNFLCWGVLLIWIGLPIKRQEESRSDKKCQEASRTYFSFIWSLRCYILTKYDISHISNIIYWPYNILKGHNCHPEKTASVDGARGILDPASRMFFKD